MMDAPAGSPTLPENPGVTTPICPASAGARPAVGVRPHPSAPAARPGCGCRRRPSRRLRGVVSQLEPNSESFRHPTAMSAEGFEGPMLHAQD